MRKMKFIGKALLTLGATLILFVVVLIMMVVFPPEWVGYVLTKVFSLFAGESNHIFFKIVPSSNDYGYLILAAIGATGVTLVYYGNKLNGSAIK